MIRLFRRFVVGMTLYSLLVLVVGKVLRNVLPDTGTSEGADFAKASVLEGVEYANRNATLRHGSAQVVMGGLRIDLREAIPAPQGAQLDLFCKAGGISVLVPQSWRVDVQANGLMGMTSADTTPLHNLPSDAPTLTVRSTVVFGGVQIDAV